MNNNNGIMDFLSIAIKKSPIIFDFEILLMNFISFQWNLNQMEKLKFISERKLENSNWLVKMLIWDGGGNAT